MARTVRDARLESKAARRALIVRGKPYYRGLEPGLHLGYRRAARGSGKWVTRHYIGDQQYEVEVLAIADDLSDADGVAILNFAQAQTAARARMVSRAHAASGIHGPVTVGHAISDYLAYLGNERKSVDDAKYRADAFILPGLGTIEISKLTTQRLRSWLNHIAASPARLRTKPGAEQKHRETVSGAEQRRQRQSTANRTLTVLKAALNRQWSDGAVSSDAEWRRVKPFRNVESARIRYLSVPEAQMLIDAASPDFRKLVIAALQTGARYGELMDLQVSDFNNDVGTLTINRTKSGAPRHIILTDEGVSFFRTLVSGRFGKETMLLKRDGNKWSTSHQRRPMIEACQSAGIPYISFHGLRHTWASLAVMQGVELMIVAKNLGHSDTRMVERHYGHMAPSYIANAIRDRAPRFVRTLPQAVGKSGA